MKQTQQSFYKTQFSFPLVSVLIPTYNGEAFVSKAIQSALEQTYPNLEIIICDDGSTDNTLKIAEQFKQYITFPYQVIAHPNYGLVKNLNFCIQQAQGKYIKFIFQDDGLEPNCIEELVKLAEQDQEIGLVFSPRQVFIQEQSNSNLTCKAAYRGAVNLHKKWSKLKSIQSGQKLLSDPNCLVGTLNKIGEPTTVLISKQVFEQLGGFDPNLQQLLDVDLWFRIMGHYKVGFVDQSLSYLLIHQHQQTQKNLARGENFKDYERLYLKMMVDPVYHFLSSELKLKILQKSLSYPKFYNRLINYLLKQYQQDYCNLTLTNLKLIRQVLAQYCLTLSAQQFEARYLNEILPNYKLLVNSILMYEEIDPTETCLLNLIKQQLSQEAITPRLIPPLMALMLFQDAVQMGNIYQNAIIPNYCFSEFINWLFSTRLFFTTPEEIDQSVEFKEKLLDYMIGCLNNTNNQDLVWNYILQHYILLSNHYSCIVTQSRSEKIFKLQSKIIEYALNIKPKLGQRELQYTRQNSKMRIGILIETLGYNPDTITAIPIFEYWERSQFKIFLYCFNIEDQNLADYCYNKVDKIYNISEQFPQVISFLSQQNLDIFIMASNITNRVNVACQIIAHRFALIQIILSASSPLRTGLKNVDYRLRGDLITTEPNVKNDQSEQLLIVKGSGVCFSYPVALPQLKLQMSRNGWGATEETIILIATANFFTLTPQLRETWTEIIAFVPNTILVLCPKQTEEDTKILPCLRRRMDLLFDRYNLDKERLIISPLPSWVEVKQAVGLADIYLEAFAGNHPLSLVEALRAGVPPVVKQGSASHTQTASAILQELGLTEWVKDSPEAYFQQALALATDLDLRQDYRQRIQTLMGNHPQILNHREYSQQIGILLMRLYQQKLGKQP